MLRPSYAELMDVLNRETEGDEEITSRYTIVIATAKRARQIIDGDEPMVPERKGKPVSTAVDELYQGKIKIVPEGKGTIINNTEAEKSDSMDCNNNDSEKINYEETDDEEIDDEETDDEEIDDEEVDGEEVKKETIDNFFEDE